MRNITHFNEAKQYIKNKYNWSEKTFNEIEWSLHHKRIRKPGRHSIIVKLKYIHQFLPSGEVIFDIPHKCKYCNKTKSTTTPHDHFLQCNQSNIIKIKRLSLIINILINTFNPQSLIHIIIEGISSYYNDHDTTDTSNLLNNDLVITQHQNAIGWDNFGHFKKKKLKQLSQSWISIIIGNVIDIFPDSWKGRCQDIHGLHTSNKEYTSNKDNILATVKAYYDWRYIPSYEENKWFGRDIESFARMNEQSIRTWIKVAKKMISDNKRKQIKEHQHPITTYFTRLNSTTKSSQSPVAHQSTEARN